MEKSLAGDTLDQFNAGKRLSQFSNAQFPMTVTEVGRAGEPDGSYQQVRPVRLDEEVALSKLARKTLALWPGAESDPADLALPFAAEGKPDAEDGRARY